MGLKVWTKDEDSILIKYYSKEGTNIANRLPGRTVNAVKNRAQYLGLIFRQAMQSWSDNELAILREYYPQEGKKAAERLPNRSIETVQMMAYRLGLKKLKKLSKER